MAKFRSGDGYAAAGDALQIHGGIGMTWEFDLHLWLKRVKLNRSAGTTSPAMTDPPVPAGPSVVRVTRPSTPPRPPTVPASPAS